jgi:hypothetical protein
MNKNVIPEKKKVNILFRFYQFSSQNCVLCNKEMSIMGISGDMVRYFITKECELDFCTPCRNPSLPPGRDVTDNSNTFSPTDLLRFYFDDQIIEGEVFMM